MSRVNETIDIPTPDLWERHVMALEDVTDRLERISTALLERNVPFALVGGQAVAIWVASIEPAAVRTTKDVDILLRREDLPIAKAAALSRNLEYFEVLGVGMFLEKSNPNPRRAILIVWADEKVRPENGYAAPSVDERVSLAENKPVMALSALTRMKLIANRDQDRVHLRDMIEVGLIGRDMLKTLPIDLAGQLDGLLTESGR